MTSKFRLRELLEEADMSQAELARLSGVHIVTISRLFRNASAQVSLETLDRIAEVLDIEPGDTIRRVPKRGKHHK